jgi:CheY-like chemotaxis protein
MGSREWPFAILIVEDHALIASSIEDIARTMGACAIGRAGKLSDALTLIETVSWDAALLDFRLTQGEMTYPAADQLRAKGVPFAFVTGWDGDVDPQYSGVPVLKKPFSEAALKSCLQMLIDKAPDQAGEHEAA